MYYLQLRHYAMHAVTYDLCRIETNDFDVGTPVYLTNLRTYANLLPATVFII